MWSNWFNAKCDQSGLWQNVVHLFSVSPYTAFSVYAQFTFLDVLRISDSPYRNRSPFCSLRELKRLGRYRTPSAIFFIFWRTPSNYCTTEARNRYLNVSLVPCFNPMTRKEAECFRRHSEAYCATHSFTVADRLQLQ